MLKKSFLPVLAVAAFSLVAFGADLPLTNAVVLLHKPSTVAEAEAQARQLMETMTPQERFDFVCGNGFGVRAVPRLGIPALNFGDASCGLRIAADPSGKHKTTAFPCTLLLAAAWDPSVANEYGKSVAEEFRVEDKHFILGPGMNLYRTSKAGRNFEFLGEDPFLASQVVASYVKGAQGVGVGTTLKHFIGNETENHRRAANSIIDLRTLNEIYLPPFKAGVDAGAFAVMTAYNPLNGMWCGQNKFVCTDLLRDQLGFKYLIMTDWASTWHGDTEAQSGMDLDEPEGFALKQDREKIFRSPDIDRMVTDILKTGIASGIYESESKGEFKKPEWLDKYPEHEQFARRLNGKGIVLLANHGILPLDSAPKGKILVSGNAAMQRELAGGGSGHVVGYHLNTYLETAEKAFGADKIIYREKPTDEEIKTADVILLFVGRPFDGKIGHEGESSNHPFELPEDSLVAHCTQLNSRTVVNLICGGGARMDWEKHAAAIVLAFYGGQTGPEALFDILTGKINPSGKLPFTIEKHFEDSCAAGDESLVKPGQILADPRDLAERVKKTKRNDFIIEKDGAEYRTYDLPYREGIFVGYRWYDEKKIQPRFPFGFGLSYTSFNYSDLSMTTSTNGAGISAVAHFKIKNTGQRGGDEVAQVYVEFPRSDVPQPVRALKGFARVHLEPGEVQAVTVSLGSDAFSFWHPEKQSWVMARGTFKVDIGASSRDIKLTKKISN